MNTSRKKHSARSRNCALPSLRGALATKQSTVRLLHSRPWIASLALAMTVLGRLKIESENAAVATEAAPNIARPARRHFDQHRNQSPGKAINIVRPGARVGLFA